MDWFIVGTLVFGSLAFALSFYMLYRFKETQEQNINNIKQIRDLKKV